MSDKHIQVTSRIYAAIDEGGDAYFDNIVAILREAYPSAQGEDERALAISRDGLLQLQLALNDAVNDIVGVFPPQTDIKKALIKAANDYINGVADYVAALRSRLAEPEPAQAAPSKDELREYLDRAFEALRLYGSQSEEVFQLAHKRPVPSSLAAMFCNMTERHSREMAKAFTKDEIARRMAIRAAFLRSEPRKESKK